MIDLTKKSLPNTVEVDGRLYSVYTDFRVWMKFEIALAASHGREPIPIDYLFKNERPIYCDVRELLKFSRPARELPRKVSGTASDDVIVIDFRIDADLIYAAFLQQYRIDLTEVEELHWNKFLALLNGLTETKLSEVMGYRCYERHDRKDIDPYEEMREAWRIEKPLTREEQDELDDFNKQFMT